MTFFLENLLLYIFCISIFPFENFNLIHLICFLLIFSLICLKITFQNKKAELIFDFIYLISSFFEPLLLLQFPAIAYYNFYKKNYIIFIPVMILMIIHFKPLGFLPYIFLTLILFLSLYLANLSRKKEKLENQVHELRDNSVEHEIILKEQNRKLIDKQNDDVYIAVLQERNRIAREIHDNVGHMLSRSILQLAAMNAICKDETLKPHLITLNDSLNEAMNNIRNSVHDLHDEAVSLEDAIHSILSEFNFCKVDFSYQIHTKLPKEIKYCFLAIIKEALNNVMKHSNGTEVKLSLKEQSSFYQLIIKDNGTVNQNNLGKSDGIGLKSMKERVESNKGILHLSYETGMRIFITIPK